MLKKLIDLQKLHDFLKEIDLSLIFFLTGLAFLLTPNTHECDSVLGKGGSLKEIGLQPSTSKLEIMQSCPSGSISNSERITIYDVV